MLNGLDDLYIPTSSLAICFSVLEDSGPSGWRTGSPWLLDRCDEEAGREEQSSPTFDLR